MEKSRFRIAKQPIVVIVESDPALLNSLGFAFDVDGFSTRIFASPKEILTAPDLPESGCLVLDYDLPEMNGILLLERLRQRGLAQPAILITSRPQNLGAIGGAIIVEKPLLGPALSKAIHLALSGPLERPQPA